VSSISNFNLLYGKHPNKQKAVNLFILQPLGVKLKNLTASDIYMAERKEITLWACNAVMLLHLRGFSWLTVQPLVSRRKKCYSFLPSFTI